jgi:hypothetical protein
LPVTWDRDETLTVSGVSLELRDIRLIGDAAPGDSRTSRDQLKLSWPASAVPVVSFGNAPPGLYSRLRATVREFDVDAQVQRDQDDSPWQLELDTEGNPVQLDIALGDVILPVGGLVTLEVDFELDKVLKDIDFGSIEVEDGEGELDPGDAGFDVVIEKLREAFSIRALD